MSRTTRTPRERNDLVSSGPGTPIRVYTTMCGMCSRRISATEGASRPLPNGRWMRVCPDHAPRRAGASA